LSTFFRNATCRSNPEVVAAQALWRAALRACHASGRSAPKHARRVVPLLDRPCHVRTASSMLTSRSSTMSGTGRFGDGCHSRPVTVVSARSRQRCVVRCPRATADSRRSTRAGHHTYPRDWGGRRYRRPAFAPSGRFAASSELIAALQRGPHLLLCQSPKTYQPDAAGGISPSGRIVSPAASE
jgi:hypothetical protein